MKPRVFLSHSSKDKPFIQKIANSLRIGKIDAWYDDWEIPPGDSIRRVIFEEGIPNCDVFFVYLTENSIDSYWVQKELDSAMIKDSDNRNSTIVLFCNEDSVRSKLSLDLRSLNIPVLNEKEYSDPMIKLIAKTYSIQSEKKLSQLNLEKESQILRIKNENLELKNQLLSKNSINVSDAKSTLESTVFEFNSIEKNLWEIFFHLRYGFADGIQANHISRALDELFKVLIDKSTVFSSSQNRFTSKYAIWDVTGPLLLLDILQLQPETDQTGQIYYLSEYGKELARS